MSDDREILAERLRARVAASGRSPRDISLAASGKPDLVRDIERGRRMPSAPVMLALAAELETTTDWLLGRAESDTQPLSEVSFREVPQRWNGPDKDGIRVLGTGYCDDLAVEGEDGALFEVERVLLETDHVVRMIERPAALWNAPEAYAIYCHGDSMEPRFYQGEIGVADPRRPPSPGDDVVVQLTDGNGGSDVVTVLVKQLVRATSAYIELRQFNPPRTFRIPRRQVARLHRLCNRNELLGG